MMHGREKSDLAIVAAKQANKAGQPAAESVERRAGGQGDSGSATHVPDTAPGLRVTGAGSPAARRQRLAVLTRGRSRMRESRTYGSVRGAGSNARPYRDRWITGARAESRIGRHSAPGLNRSRGRGGERRGGSQEAKGQAKATACLKIVGFNPMRDRSFCHARESHQPAASALDR